MGAVWQGIGWADECNECGVGGVMAFTLSVAELIDADTSGLLAKHPTWERVPLAHVASILNGAPFDSALFSATEGMPLVRIRDVIAGETSTYYTGPYDDVDRVQQGVL